jgi:hypothetical protein
MADLSQYLSSIIAFAVSFPVFLGMFHLIGPPGRIYHYRVTLCVVCALLVSAYVYAVTVPPAPFSTDTEVVTRAWLRGARETPGLVGTSDVVYLTGSEGDKILKADLVYGTGISDYHLTVECPDFEGTLLCDEKGITFMKDASLEANLKIGCIPKGTLRLCYVQVVPAE